MANACFCEIFKFVEFQYINTPGTVKWIGRKICYKNLSLREIPGKTINQIYQCDNVSSIHYCILCIKVWIKKKVSKLGWKFYLIKSCSIEFKLSYFLDKVSGKNMLRFQLNRTTFYLKKILLRKMTAENCDNVCFTIFLKVS